MLSLTFIKVSHNTGPMLDALVMIVGNTEFTNWIFAKFSELQISWSARFANKNDLKIKTGPERKCCTERIEMVILSNDLSSEGKV